MLQVIASLPGLYAVHYLDAVTYSDPATGPALGADPEFPLAEYPSKDVTFGTAADPYNPQASGLRSRRLGLSSMEERARRLGGQLTIESVAGEGTTVRLEAPVD